MDFDHNLVFNHASAFAPVLLICATSLTIFYKLRMRLPMKVNCWFCNEDAKILRQNLDWWLCPWCEQYNGFSKTGDYSFNIPEQYTTSNKCARYCKAARNMGNSPSLCMDCNERETLKLTTLSTFEPIDERFYNQELKIFKKDLEDKYPVCNKCKSMVSRVLKKQALWLTRYKMLFFRQKPVKAIIHKARKWEMIFRVISITLDSVIVYNNDLIWPLVGLFFHLCATWACSITKNNYNMLLTLLWFCIILLIFIKNLIISPIFWLTSEHILQYHMITICASIIVFVGTKATSCKNTLTGSVAFKKLRQNVYDNHDEDDNVLNETSSSTETVSEISELNVTEVKPQLAILKQLTTSVSNNRSNTNLLSRSKNSWQNTFCLDDSLSTLSLSEDSRKCSNNAKVTATIFERRIYDVTSSENLFKKFANASNKKHILAPPKLKSVTQTSWVAGGYWQESMMTPPSTLSRSSSQSSGFGSAGSSNLAFSREPSVHEFDRCSVMSDGTRSCYTPRPTHATTNPVRRGSPVPQFHSQPRFRDAATMNNHHSPSVSSPLLRATYNRENCVQESYVSRDPDVEQRNGPMPVYPSHTTIIASPGWLSAMFCGSLVLNMIVLCTMLLHILH